MTRLDDVTRSEIVRRYASGEPGPALALEYGLHRNMPAKLARLAGHPDGRSRSRRPASKLQWLREQVARYDAEGWPDECVEWPFGRTGGTHDYGRVSVDGKQLYVHRVVLGPEHEACHRCDNPPCFNRRHLFDGTHAENLADMSEKGRNRFGRNGPDRRAVVKRYEAGERTVDLAAECGVTDITILRWVRRFGGTPRRPGGWNKRAVA